MFVLNKVAIYARLVKSCQTVFKIILLILAQDAILTIALEKLAFPKLIKTSLVRKLFFFANTPALCNTRYSAYSISKNALAKKAAIWSLVTGSFGQ